MRKILLIIFLLILHQQGIAGCSEIMNWQMNIKNDTSESKLKFSCSGGVSFTLDQGESNVVTGETGDGCGQSYSDGPSCTYTDEATGLSGSITLHYDSCVSVKTNSTAAGNKFTAFGCNAKSSDGYSGRTVCDYVDTSYQSYSSSASFVIVDQGPSYKFDWTGIDLTPAKGQVMADKLAKSLLRTGEFGSAKASYNSSTSTVTIYFDAPTTNTCS